MINKTFILYFGLCFLYFSSLAIVNGNNASYSTDTIIIKFSSANENEILSFINKSGAYSYERAFPAPRNSKEFSHIYILKFPVNIDLENLLVKFNKEKIIEYAQPNYMNYLCASIPIKTNDPFFPNQWALQIIKAPEAWNIEKGSKDIVIAVVDTGVDYTHEDLKDRIWKNPGENDKNGVDDDGNGYIDDVIGWDFVDSPDMITTKDHLFRDNDPMDENGHGTHVAGILGAVPDNSNGIAGVVWNCRIMVLRAGGDYMEDDDLSAAIVYAADNGARIINMSWGSDNLSYVIRDVLKYAYNRGCILIAAAGNDDSSKVIYPALHNHVLAVGATDRMDKKAYFSNYGPGIDIVAPGHRIFGTTIKDKYSDWSGTSMATPLVSGVAALMLSKRPDLTNEEVYQILKSTADEIDEPEFYQAGRINAVKALIASVPIMAKIKEPDNGTGADKSIDVIGEAAGTRFSEYKLEYAKMNPEAKNLDWRLIKQGNRRIFHDLLGTWDTQYLDEGDYIIRLKVFGDNYYQAEDKIMMNVDHSHPEITEVRALSRIHENRYRYVVTWYTDDLSSGELYYRPSGSKMEFQKLITGAIGDESVIYVSDYLAPGGYEYYVRAINRAGLPSIDDNKGLYYRIEIGYQKIPEYGFSERYTGISEIHPLAEGIDLDSDGFPEILGMETQWQYDTVKVYEREASGTYKEVFSSDEDYFPWDIDDTDNDGLYEILGSNLDSTFLYESPSSGKYPERKIWEVKGIWGGKIADLDGDGNKEIISRHLESGEIYIYENRGNNSYLRTTRLKNPTSGNNRLGMTFAISDFDCDSRNELVAGDWDGDLFIYENTSNDVYQHTWTGKLPGSKIKYICPGNLDADKEKEFIVGAYVDEIYNPLRQRWIYAVFDCIGDNQYKMAWSQEITGKKSSESGVSTGDLDGDGIDEIIIVVTPSIYVFKYSKPDLYEPMWYHLADSTQRPLVRFNSNGINDVLFNHEGILKAFSWVLYAQGPWGLTATPLGEHEIELRWNTPPGFHLYRIYRGTEKDNLHIIASFDSEKSLMEPGYFLDRNLENGTTYWYAIASIDNQGKEKEISNKASATPNSPPKLLSAEHLSLFQIRLKFSEPMGLSAQNESQYVIAYRDNFVISPSSAILIYHNEQVILNLADPLKDGNYRIIVSDVRDITGVPISKDGNSVVFEVAIPVDQKWKDLKQMIIYPNPVIYSKNPGRITFDNLPYTARIRVYDLSGQLVRTLGESENNNGRIIWYLDNEHNREIASGIYIYIAEYNNDRRSGKIGIIR